MRATRPPARGSARRECGSQPSRHKFGETFSHRMFLAGRCLVSLSVRRCKTGAEPSTVSGPQYLRTEMSACHASASASGRRTSCTSLAALGARRARLSSRRARLLHSAGSYSRCCSRCCSRALCWRVPPQARAEERFCVLQNELVCAAMCSRSQNVPGIHGLSSSEGTRDVFSLQSQEICRSHVKP